MGESLYQISKKSHKWRLETDFFQKLNSVLDREEWRMTPQTVNAYFMPTQNEIVFPAAILQEPFFWSSGEVDFEVKSEVEMAGDNLDMSMAANFGGIGAVIAHEITHGYDDKGRRFDGQGNLNDWWTTDDADKFKVRVHARGWVGHARVWRARVDMRVRGHACAGLVCASVHPCVYACVQAADRGEQSCVQAKTDMMAAQAEQYVYIDASDGDKSYAMNPQLCMGENLADLGGLSLSLQALKHRLAAANVDETTMKASLRVAFKSWANIWKRNIKKDTRIQRLTSDPHAPEDFRGCLVANMAEFYDCFDVKEGDKMFIAPENRVRMW